MAYPITIPRLGWSMEEGTLSEWLMQPGTQVKAGDLLFMLEGEKAAQEIESLDSGMLCIPADAPQPGETVKVGQVIGFLLAEGEVAPTTVRVAIATSSFPSSQPSVRSSSAVVNTSQERATKNERVAGPASRRLARQLGVDIQSVMTPDPTGRVLTEDIHRSAVSRPTNESTITISGSVVATPRARRRARELNIDWQRLAGTGRDGRIRERDVLVAARGAPDRVEVAEPLPGAPGQHVAASKLRRVIAQRMMAGVHTAAPVTITTKVDASALVAYRSQLKLNAAGVSDSVPSYNDILISLTAQTLRDLPALNACWLRDGIYQYDEIHVATAIDTPDGLLAPVVRQADQLSLDDIALQTKQLIQLSRTGQLTIEQLTGATFTVTNLGMFGVDAFTPILNLPQAGILGVGRIMAEPVVREGVVVAGQTLTLSLTFDHRVIDGAPAARWLQQLGARIELPCAPRK